MGALTKMSVIGYMWVDFGIVGLMMTIGNIGVPLKNLVIPGGIVNFGVEIDYNLYHLIIFIYIK